MSDATNNTVYTLEDLKKRVAAEPKLQHHLNTTLQEYNFLPCQLQYLCTAPVDKVNQWLNNCDG